MSKREYNRVAEIMELTQPLSYEELLCLNHLIVDRLEHIETVETHKRMLEFTPGCRVSFESKFGMGNGRDHQIQSKDRQCGDRFAPSV